MIKRICMITLLMLTLGIAQASSSSWVWRFGPAYFGTQAGALDGSGPEDSLVSGVHPIWVGAYHDPDLDYWDGPSGFYSSDVRAPLTLVSGASKTWTFYLWEDPAYNRVLSLDWGWEGAAVMPDFQNTSYRLTYLRSAEGISGGSIPVGSSVLLNQVQQGGWTFPVYKTNDGQTGYKFEFTATATPEPSSLLALGGGLAALGLLRRRRTSNIPDGSGQAER